MNDSYILASDNNNVIISVVIALVIALVIVCIFAFLFVYRKAQKKKQNKENLQQKINEYNDSEFARLTKLNYNEMISSAEGSILYKACQNLLSKGKLLLNFSLSPFENESFKGDIDAILVNNSGVFFIQCKTWNGSLSGRENDEMWKLTKNDGKEVNIKNPLIENKERIKLLTQNQEDAKMVYFIFAASNRCNIDNIMITSTNNYLTTIYNLPSTIDSISKDNGVLTDDAVNHIYNSLKQYMEDCQNKKEI